jgi:hypothetical protein
VGGKSPLDADDDDGGDTIAGVLRPGRFPYEDDVEPLWFNLFQFDTLEAIIQRCAEAGRDSEDRDEYADGMIVRRSFPPITVGHLVLIPHPDDEDRLIEDEVEIAHTPGYAAAAMLRLIDRFADRVRFDEDTHAVEKRSVDDAGPNRSDFLALDPAPGVPILEHARLSEVVAELRLFLQKVRLAGFDVEF